MEKKLNVNIYHDKYDVYCGRGKGIKNDPAMCKIGEYGWLGNPIKIGSICTLCNNLHSDGGSTLNCYEKYLRLRLKEEDFYKEFVKLNGKVLGCFCKPKPCHTDIMVKILKEIFS